LARTRKKRAGKRKAQRRAIIKRKAEAEQALVHIDEMLELDSGITVKAGGGSSKVRRTERHQMTGIFSSEENGKFPAESQAN
jgi:hypothetical protein